jgi:murein DD-endopeptidase MepM/ murein hydrolase activator NlpD
VAIDHGQGVVSFYIHLSKILVKEGDTVEAGQKIGLIGSTGRASGPHLHFSLYVNNDATSPWNWFRNVY